MIDQSLGKAPFELYILGSRRPASDPVDLESPNEMGGGFDVIGNMPSLPWYPC